MVSGVSERTYKNNLIIFANNALVSPYLVRSRIYLIVYCCRTAVATCHSSFHPPAPPNQILSPANYPGGYFSRARKLKSKHTDLGNELLHTP